MGGLAPGEAIEVTWDALPGRVWQGTVSNIPSTVKLRGTRNVGETTCLVDNPDFKLLPNINVGVTIVTAEHHDVLTVPREAIHLDDSKTYVYQIVNDRIATPRHSDLSFESDAGGDHRRTRARRRGWR